MYVNENDILAIINAKFAENHATFDVNARSYIILTRPASVCHVRLFSFVQNFYICI